MQRYDIRLPIPLWEARAAASPEIAAIPIAPATITLDGLTHDQGERRGVLARIADLGSETIGVRQDRS